MFYSLIRIAAAAVFLMLCLPVRGLPIERGTHIGTRRDGNATNDDLQNCYFTCPVSFKDATGVSYSNIAVPLAYGCQYISHTSDGSTNAQQCIYDLKAGTINAKISYAACPTALVPVCGDRPKGGW